MKTFATVAQRIEQPHSKRLVKGSIPFCGTNFEQMGELVDPASLSLAALPRVGSSPTLLTILPTIRKSKLGFSLALRALTFGMVGILLCGCVMNNNVLITRDTIMVTNNVSLSEKLLRLLFL